MASLLPWHNDLIDGKGKCSVPLWIVGMPAGFCEVEAYGGRTSIGRNRYNGFVPALACFRHGGPYARAEEKKIV